VSGHPSIFTTLGISKEPAGISREPAGISKEPAGDPGLRMLGDEPLRHDWDDKLEFASYADAIAGLIDKPETITPLTIAINAPWGAGKSTLARMVKHRLEVKPAAGGFYPHATCWFNAWLYDDAPNLASAFAGHVARSAARSRPLWRRVTSPLSSQLRSPLERRRTRVSVLVGAFILALMTSSLYFPRLMAMLGIHDHSDPLLARSVGLTTAILIVYTAVSLFAKALTGYASVAKSVAEFVKDPSSAAANGSLDEVRQQLGRLVRQATPKGSRFIIFVDDLERCRPPRALEVLEVAHQLFCLRDVVTVVLADMPAISANVELKYRDVAERYAKELSGQFKRTREAYGRIYLQKIIQLQFDLPAIRASRLKAMIKASVSMVNVQDEEPLKPWREQRSTLWLDRLRRWMINLGRVGLFILFFAFALVADDIISGREVDFGLLYRFLVWGALFIVIVGALLGLLIFITVKQTRSLVTRARSFIDERIREQISKGATDFSTVQESIRREMDSTDFGMPRDWQDAFFINTNSFYEQADRLILERVQNYLENESELQREAEEEVMDFLPPLPRNAKRLLNRLRFLLFVAYARRMFGGEPDLNVKHIAKWAVLSERWPELAQVLSESPEEMKELEGRSKEPAEFYNRVKELAALYQDDVDLLFFVRSGVRLGNVLSRLVHFDRAEPPTPPAAVG